MISVVVPVYNVSKYLDKCIESLVRQTYRDYEIILVDDGSLDGSSEICDKYGELYSFIKVFHKPNGGLSDARNFAIDYVSGEYISFVDSDDYVDPDYLEALYALTEEGKFDISSVAHYDELPDGTVIGAKIHENNFRTVSAKEALRLMCYEDEFGTTACAKLFSVKLLKKHKFPVGKIYEDLFTVYKLVGDANGVSISRAPKYHYIKRQESIRHTKWNNRVYNVWEATDCFKQYIAENFPDVSIDVVNRLFISAGELYIRAFNEKNYIDIIKDIRKELKTYLPIVKSNNNISRKTRLKYKLMVSHPKIYRAVWRFCHR